MLAKKYKLPIQQFVGKRGRLVKSGLFLVKIFPSLGKTPESEPPINRFGVTISAKVAPKANSRNRLRRLVYDSIKEYYNEIPSGDYWITVLSPATLLSKGPLKKEIRKLLTSNF